MKNIHPLTSKNKSTILIILGVFVIISLIGFNIFLSRPKMNNPSPEASTSSPLHKQLQATYDKIPTQSGKNDFLKQSNNLTQKVDAELVDLDSQIITCDANVDGLLSTNPTFGSSCVAGNGGTLMNTKGLYLGGQCCGALMDTNEYHDRLKKLQAYKSMPDIVLDPMHTPIALAKQWIDYDNSTILTPDEQKVYDQAYAMSKEKPCCCKCWHYFTNEGIAKKMITSGMYTSQQIANYWDDSEICGV